MATERSTLVGLDGPGVMDRVVNKKQLKGYPSTTLVCARTAKIVIMAAILATTITLIVTYFGGSLEVQTSVTKISSFSVPELVLCPVWGQPDLTVTISSVSIGNGLTEDYAAWPQLKPVTSRCGPLKYPHVTDDGVEMRAVDPKAQAGCHCVKFPEGTALQDAEVGKESMRVVFATESEMPVSFGFQAASGTFPPDFAYAVVGQRNVGDIALVDRAYAGLPLQGKTVISSYTYSPRVAYPVVSFAGVAVAGPQTELVISPASFFITEVADISSVWSVYALIGLAVLVMANLNSAGLFDMCFPEKQDPHDPRQLEPHWCLRSTCFCSSCCQPLQKDTEV
jgi:hypothetical protein